MKYTQTYTREEYSLDCDHPSSGNEINVYTLDLLNKNFRQFVTIFHLVTSTEWFKRKDFFIL